MAQEQHPTSDPQTASTASDPTQLDPPTVAPAPPPPASAEEQAPAIEAQVDALLDQAEKQVQTMSDLVDGPAPESAPPKAAPSAPAKTNAETTPAAAAPSPAEKTPAAPAVAKPVETTSAPQPPPTAAAPTAPAPNEPLDTKALQGQVDAILAEAGQPIEGDTDDSSSTPEAAEDDSAPSDSDEEGEPAEIDIADVDAVIADAAQRAMEEDDFETNASSRDAAAAPVADAASASAAAPSKPKAVLKGGDASKRRDKPKVRRPKGADLDGGFPAPPREGEESDDSADPAAAAPILLEPEPPDPRLRARLARFTLQRMAVMNAPWHAWPPATRYAVLAFTILNLSLAAAAYVVLLRRWL